MFSCFSGIRTHARDLTILGDSTLKKKVEVLAHCIRSIREIKESGAIQLYLRFLCECVSGEVKNLSYVPEHGIYKHIYALTGNANNNIFARQIVTKGATILLFALCVSYKRLVNENDLYGTREVSIPEPSASLSEKFEFIKQILSFNNALKDLEDAKLVIKYLKIDYLKFCAVDDKHIIGSQDNTEIFGINEESLSKKVKIGEYEVNFRDVRYVDNNFVAKLIIVDSKNCLDIVYIFDSKNNIFYLSSVANNKNKNVTTYVGNVYFASVDGVITAYDSMKSAEVASNEENRKILSEIRDAFIGYNDCIDDHEDKIVLPYGFNEAVENFVRENNNLEGSE